jgi:RNA polymerase sigma factor (sigma-70 family)
VTTRKRIEHTGELTRELYFEQAFQLYWRKVYNLCLHYTRDKAASKDLTQNIFLSLWENGKNFRDLNHIERYLTGAAKFQVLGHFRKSGRIELTEVFPESGTARSISPESFLQYKELATQLHQSIESLKEPTRTIFRLNREEGLSYKQIASIMNLGVKSVEYHVSSALRHLRKGFTVIKK